MSVEGGRTPDAQEDLRALGDMGRVEARMESPCRAPLMPAPIGDRLRNAAALALFVVLAGYVGFSAIRLALLLWQRFAAG